MAGKTKGLPCDIGGEAKTANCGIGVEGGGRKHAGRRYRQKEKQGEKECSRVSQGHTRLLLEKTRVTDVGGLAWLRTKGKKEGPGQSYNFKKKKEFQPEPQSIQDCLGLGGGDRKKKKKGKNARGYWVIPAARRGNPTHQQEIAGTK